jgi:hypothetical protein
MSYTHESNKTKNKTKQEDVVVAVAVLAIAAMIFTTGTSYMISIQDVQAKNRHALDLPLKTEERKHDTTNGPSCKNSENSEFESRDFASVVVGNGDDDDDEDRISRDRDSSNAPPGVDPNKCIPGNECPPECLEGWNRATPPINPQLGCLPDNIKSN